MAPKLRQGSGGTQALRHVRHRALVTDGGTPLADTVVGESSWSGIVFG
jgi:hypothetical protein